MLITIEFNPMTKYPQKIEGEHHSRTVLVYDKDLEDFDLGFYDYETEKWNVFGGFQMDLLCWCEVPKPKKYEVGHFESHLIDC